MRTFADCTEAVATGDTVETSMGVITLSTKAKRIVGVWATALGGATLTTGEAVTGIFRLDSPDFNIAPFKAPLAVLTILTQGTGAYEPRIIPVNIPCSGNGRVTAYITMDMAQTGALKGRVGLLYEGDE